MQTIEFVSLEEITQRPGDNMRRLAAQMLELAEDLDAGRATPQAGAGVVARLPNEGRWHIDLEMEFSLSEKPTH